MTSLLALDLKLRDAGIISRVVLCFAPKRNHYSCAMPCYACGGLV